MSKNFRNFVHQDAGGNFATSSLELFIKRITKLLVEWDLSDDGGSLKDLVAAGDMFGFLYWAAIRPHGAARGFVPIHTALHSWKLDNGSQEEGHLKGWRAAWCAGGQ